MATRNQLFYGEERQIMVTNLPGIKGLPCMPLPGCAEACAFIPNGTFVTFVGVHNMGADCVFWHMRLTDNSKVEVLITPDALMSGWLWKAKRPAKLLTRKRRW